MSTQAETLIVGGVDVTAAVKALALLKDAIDQVREPAVTASAALKGLETLNLSTTESAVRRLAGQVGALATNAERAKIALGGLAGGGGMTGGAGGVGAPGAGAMLASDQAGLKTAFTAYTGGLSGPEYSRAVGSKASLYETLAATPHGGEPNLSGRSEHIRALWEGMKGHGAAWAAAPIGLMGGMGDMHAGLMHGAASHPNPLIGMGAAALPFLMRGVLGRSQAGFFDRFAEGVGSRDQEEAVTAAKLESKFALDSRSSQAVAQAEAEAAARAASISGGATSSVGPGASLSPYARSRYAAQYASPGHGGLMNLPLQGGAQMIYGEGGLRDRADAETSRKLAQIARENQYGAHMAKPAAERAAIEAKLEAEIRAGGGPTPYDLTESYLGAHGAVQEANLRLGDALNPSSPDGGGGGGSGLGRFNSGGGDGGAGGGGRKSKGPLAQFGKHFMYGLTAMPAYALAGVAFSGVSKSIAAMSAMQTAEQQAAFAQPGASDGLIDNERNISGNIGVQYGYAPADIMTTMNENYRLTKNVSSAIGLTRTSALLGRLTGNDPATSQGQLAAVVKAMDKNGGDGVKSASELPDILASAYRLYDTTPKELMDSTSKGINIAKTVGIGAPQGKDLAAFVAMNATLQQDLDLNQASTQSAMRMFFADLRNPSKEKSLHKMGLDIGGMSGYGMLETLAKMDQQGPTGHQKALEMLEKLAGNKTGFQAEEFLSKLPEIAANTRTMAASVGGGGGQAYANAMVNNTISGQMSRMASVWDKMWGNPNALPTQAVGGFLGAFTQGLQTIDQGGTAAAVFDTMHNDPVLGKVGDAHKTLAGPLMDPTEDVAMVNKMKQIILDPNTSDAVRNHYMSIFNKVEGLTGGGQYTWHKHGQQAPAPVNRPGGVPASVPNAYRSAVAAAAKHAGVSPAVIAEQIAAESSWNPRAQSPAGAQGIAQFMPGTAKAYGLKDPFDPIASIDAEGRYMADLMKQYGSVERALSAYNSGKPDAYLDPNFAQGQTHDYVQKIMAAAAKDNAHAKAGLLPGRNFPGIHDLVKAFGSAQGFRDTSHGYEDGGYLYGDDSVRSKWTRGKPEKGGKWVDHVHTGIDISMTTGTGVPAEFGGKVIEAFSGARPGDKKANYGYGNSVLVRDPSGRYTERIAHLSEVDVKVGQTVGAGDVLGLSGTSGNSTAPHLHEEFMRLSDRHFVNPYAIDKMTTLAEQPGEHPVPPPNYRKHIDQITHDKKRTQQVIDGSRRMDVNPLVAMAILREEGRYRDIPAMYRIAAQHEYGLKPGNEEQTQAFLAQVIGTLDIGQSKGTAAKEIKQSMDALKTWGYFKDRANMGTITIDPQTGTNANSSSAIHQELVTQTGLLQNAVDQLAAQNGYLNRMANFNVPAGYTIPTYEAWVSHTAAHPQSHPSGSPGGAKGHGSRPHHSPAPHPGKHNTAAGHQGQSMHGSGGGGGHALSQ